MRTARRLSRMDHRPSAKRGQAAALPQRAPSSPAISPAIIQRCESGERTWPRQTTIDGDYDYIIVGAGSAGCLLANRLSADADKRVLVLEAGGRDNWIWFHIPVGYLFAIGNPRSDWCFKTEPEPGLNGRSLNYPRGKVIGGSSAINAMIYMRGQAADYDHWRQLGLAGWGWDDVLPFFKRHENHFMGESAAHAVGGEWPIAAPRVRWDLLEAFRAAAEQAGIKSIADFNTGDNEGACAFHVNQKRGRRCLGGARLPQAGAQSPQSAARNRLPGRRPGDRRQARRRRALAARNGIKPRRAWRVAAAKSFLPPARSARHRSCCCPASARRSICKSMVSRSCSTGPASAPTCRIICNCAPIYKVDGITTLNERYHSPLGFARMLAEYALLRRGPLTMAPSQLGLFTRSDQRPGARQPAVSRAAAVARPLRRTAAQIPRLHRQRLQSAADQPRLRAAALARSGRRAGHQAQLSRDRRGPPHRGEFYPPDPAHRGAAGAGAVSPRRISAGSRGARRR